MGMTYKIIALKAGITIKDFFPVTAPTDESIADVIIPDTVFDREDNFRKWCGYPPWLRGQPDFAFRLKLQHLQKARRVLRTLLRHVKKMPFSKNTDVCEIESFNPKTHKYETTYVGSPENIAILKVVTQVLSREYHFGVYPWEAPRNPSKVGDGVQFMIKSLSFAITFMRKNPNRIVIGLYY